MVIIIAVPKHSTAMACWVLCSIPRSAVSVLHSGQRCEGRVEALQKDPSKSVAEKVSQYRQPDWDLLFDPSWSCFLTQGNMLPIELIAPKAH